MELEEFIGLVSPLIQVCGTYVFTTSGVSYGLVRLDDHGILVQRKKGLRWIKVENLSNIALLINYVSDRFSPGIFGYVHLVQKPEDVG